MNILNSNKSEMLMKLCEQFNSKFIAFNFISVILYTLLYFGRPAPGAHTQGDILRCYYYHLPEHQVLYCAPPH